MHPLGSKAYAMAGWLTDLNRCPSHVVRRGRVPSHDLHRCLDALILVFIVTGPMKCISVVASLRFPLLAAALMASGAVNAEDASTGKAVDNGFTQGPYASLGASVGFGTGISIILPASSAYSNESFKTSTTLGPNVALGYGFGQGWRVEAEYIGYYSPATNYFTLNGQASQANGSQIATNAVQFNVLKDIGTGSRFTPYIGGGVGFASSQYNVQEGSVTGTTFAGQGKIGVSYAINKAASAYVGYRIMGIGGNTTFSIWSDKPTTGSRLQQGLDAGIRIKL